MKQIRLASEKDGTKIAELRLTEYQNAKDFTLVSTEYLKWDETDRQCPVVAVFNEQNEAIATMLVIPVNTVQKAVSSLESDLPVKIAFPAFVFKKAVTKCAYRKHGFNQLLRYHIIKAALNCDIQSLLSPVYESAPRTGFMKKIGYQFHTSLSPTPDKLIPTSTRILAVLERNRMKEALKAIEQKIPDLINSYPWIGEKIST